MKIKRKEVNRQIEIIENKFNFVILFSQQAGVSTDITDEVFLCCLGVERVLAQVFNRDLIFSLIIPDFYGASNPCLNLITWYTIIPIRTVLTRKSASSQMFSNNQTLCHHQLPQYLLYEYMEIIWKQYKMTS